MSSSNTEVFQERFVLPGDDVSAYVTPTSSSSTGKSSGQVILSRGTRRVFGSQSGSDAAATTILASAAGVLKCNSQGSAPTYSVQSRSGFYTPLVGDQVVGVVEDKGGDFYKVNIFAGAPALLDRLAFDGATKRNKPELRRGDVLYARVTLADRDLDTELSCMAASGPKKDWSSGESVYGGLGEDGLLVKLDAVSDAASLLAPDSLLLNALGRKFQFEVAIGMNGVVWLRAPSMAHTVAVRNALLNMDKLTDEFQVEAMVERLAAVASSLAKTNNMDNQSDDD